ncbi:glycosyltransferase family 4 protein [Microbacterium sp. I2]|uniref:glycosyltransferase family 4 protein n=1 Tax=Microbacterium sp. I2 TaxID=3391826 RepID=UPI003ED8B7A4
MTRLLYLHQHYRSPEESGGTRSHEFAKRLARAGYDVHIVASDQSAGEARGWTRTSRDGYTVHRVHVPYTNQMTYRQRAFAFIRFAGLASVRARALRSDLILATSTPLTIILPALFAKAFRPVPLVFEVRDLWPEMPIAVGALRNPVLKRAATWLERLAYWSAAHIIALSPGMRDGVVRTGVDPGKVTVIPNAADLDLFAPPADGAQWVSQHPELYGRKLVVYCGTLGLLNGTRYLAEVAARTRVSNPELAFVVIGDGAERDVLLAHARHLGVLGENFFVLPPVPKAEVVQVLAAATVSTSLFLPIPEMEANSANKFFDGLAAGRPVVINYGGWQKDLLEEHSAGIALNSSDFDDAADALKTLLGDEDQLRAAGRSARRLAESEFGRDSAAEALQEVLRGVAGHPV